MQNRNLYILFSIVFLQLIVSCKKDKVPKPETVEPTKWEKISGIYNVYDTNNVFLYEMSIYHTQNLDEFGNTVDSLYFENFDDNFNFTTQQDYSNSMIIQIVSPDPIKDKTNKSWEVYGISPNQGDNEFISDTIKLKFKKNNFSYYLTDLVPYYSCTCKQIAVKQ